MDLGRRAALLTPLSLLSCSQPQGPEAAADAFVDRYYIERDHQKALQLSADGAAQRVRSEQGLLQGSAGVGAQPRVYYKRTRRQEKGTDAELTYLLSIDAGGEKLKKEVRVLVRKLGEGHRVVFFTEQDLPPPK